MANIDRRAFIESLFATLAVSATIGCKTDQPKYIDNVPPEISREGIVLETAGMVNHEIQKKLGGGLLGYWGSFAGDVISEHHNRIYPPLHTFVRINGYDIYGDPADPASGERRELNGLGPDTILQVFVVPQAENEADIIRRGHERISSASVQLSEKFEGLGKARMFGKLLGMAAVINQAKLPYIAYSLSRETPPRNSNSVYAAELEVLGICQPANCYAEENRLAPDKAYGINYGLPSVLNTQDGTDKYYDFAVKGKTMEELAKIFNDDRKANFAKSDIRSNLNFGRAYSYDELGL